MAHREGCVFSQSPKACFRHGLVHSGEGPSQASRDARHQQPDPQKVPRIPRPTPVLVCTLYRTYQTDRPLSSLGVGAGPGFGECDVSWTHWPSPRHDRIHDVTTSSAASPIFKRLARASFGLMVSPCSLFLFSCYCGTLYLVIPRRLLYYASSTFSSSRTRHPFSSSARAFPSLSYPSDTANPESGALSLITAQPCHQSSPCDFVSPPPRPETLRTNQSSPRLIYKSALLPAIARLSIYLISQAT